MFTILELAYTPGGPDLASVQHNREGYGSHSSADMATASKHYL